jgi:hypothetical protein
MIDENIIKELLRVAPSGFLHHREGQELEFKESFNLAGLADYFRDFAAFSNNKGGYLIYGVTDKPRKMRGLSVNSLDRFEKIDPEKITGYLLDIFSGEINWEQIVFKHKGMSFGVFKISPAFVKPIIAKKDEGRDQSIRNGDIYYRYGGRTQKIQFAELENIINKRIETNNNNWLDLMSKIGKVGPGNAAILDTEKGIIEKGSSQVLVLDEALTKSIKFIKEGEFVEKKGSATLKLIGEVIPVDKVEVIRRVKENLIKDYPFSAMETYAQIRKQLPTCKQGEIFDIFGRYDIKNNTDYSAYNFRSKQHEDKFKESGNLPGGTPSIYNQKAIDFTVQVLKNEK